MAITEILIHGPDLNMLIFDSLRADDELSNEVLYEILSQVKGGFEGLAKYPFSAIFSTILSTKKTYFSGIFQAKPNHLDNTIFFICEKYVD